MRQSFRDGGSTLHQNLNSGSTLSGISRRFMDILETTFLVLVIPISMNANRLRLSFCLKISLQNL